MPSKTIPLIGSIIDPSPGSVLGSSIRGQQFRNCVMRLSNSKVSGGAKIEVRPLRQFDTAISPGGSGRGTAVLVWTGQGTGETVVSAFGSTNSTIYTNTTSLGAITGTVDFFSETTISGTANIVAIASNGRAWFYPDGGALTEITDAQYPDAAGLTPTGNFVHMDGYAFIACTNGQIWNSDLNSLSSWTAGNYVTASEKPDGLVGLGRVGDYIYGFGLGSSQPFYNAGNAAGSPLSPVDGASFSIGALNQYCILQFRDTVAFVGLSAENNVGVYVIEGRSPKKISTHLIDDFLAGATSLRLHQWVDNGKHLLFVGSHADATSSATAGFMYDMDIYQWTPVKLGSVTVTQTAIKRESAGNVYLVTVDATTNVVKYNGGSSLYETAVFIVGPIGDGTPHTIRRVQVIGDGFGASSAATVDIAAAHVDRTNGWGNDKTVSLRNPVAYRFGYSRAGQSRLRLTWVGGSDDVWLSALKVDLVPNDAFG